MERTSVVLPVRGTSLAALRARTASEATGATGVSGPTAADSGPVPTALVAAMRNSYAVPLVRPVAV